MASKGYTVYKHTSPHGKVYIGITCKSVNQRWNNGNGYKSNKHFYSAIQKYGWENFTHEILFTELTKAEAAQKEIELIAQYKSTLPEYGYNQSTGGESGAAGCKRSKETIDQIQEAKRNKKHNGGKAYAKAEILEHLDDIERWARNGANEADIARNFGISRQTFWKYKNEEVDIFNAIKKGRMGLVDELKGKLAEKARGFTYEETKKTIYPDGTIKEEIFSKYALPDVGAIHLLLKNLDETWRNDDAETMKLKREKLELEKLKAENEGW